MTTYYESDAAIARLSRDFLGCTLPKAEWTHAAHFATTLWLMRNAPDRDLPRAMPGLIRAYNESVGGVNSDTAGYHETITQAYLAAIRAFEAGLPPGTSDAEAVALLLATPLGDKAWPLTHWSRERLFSVEARRWWVDPDLKPLAHPPARRDF